MTTKKKNVVMEMIWKQKSVQFPAEWCQWHPVSNVMWQKTTYIDIVGKKP